MSNRGRSYLSGPRARPLLSPDREAAKFLAEQARRYQRDAANITDVVMAFGEFKSAADAVRAERAEARAALAKAGGK